MIKSLARPRAAAWEVGRLKRMLKRTFDVLVSGIALVVLSPVLLYIGFRIKKFDGGPAFFRGLRVGRSGKPFRIYKFRSMVMNADRLGGPSTSDDDPRITPIGKSLRKRKLDELPQLINVFVGDMSLVGPRPEVQPYVDMYTEDERSILSVRPGITDWASLWNSDEGALLAGSPDPERTYLEEIRPEKLRLQLKYVRERSFLTDLSILWLTALKVVGR
jgi:lipopolysaccharide/colanic/teichoic acid biosynthesis glycosyltransferase